MSVNNNVIPKKIKINFAQKKEKKKTKISPSGGNDGESNNPFPLFNSVPNKTYYSKNPNHKKSRNLFGLFSP